VLKCPTCAVLINILGGEVGAHTFFAEAFFAAVKKFGAQTNAGQLQVLASEHSQVWAARFMDELIAGVRDGTRAGLVDSMDEQAWGGFLEFLRYRIAPQTVHINGTSLFALINSIGATSPDGALLSAHYHNVETKGLLEFMVVKARMEVVGQLTVPQVKQIVQAQAKGSAHWWTT
jgi:hypothetical protein